MKIIENLILDLIESEGKISIMKFERRIFEEIVSNNQEYIDLLNKVKKEYETDIYFKKKINNYILKEYIRIAEFFASGLISGFDSENIAKSKFIKLFPKNYKINKSVEGLFQGLLPLNRETRREYLVDKIIVDDDTINQMLSSPFIKLLAIKNIQNNNEIQINTDNGRSYGILINGIELERANISDILFDFPHDKSPLVKLYKTKGYNLENENEFSKYQLIELSEKREAFDSSPRIFDTENNITVYLNVPSFDLYSFLIDLKKDIKFDLSFRPDFTIASDGIDKKVLITEALEFGKLFSSSTLGNNLITKLYDVNNDHLWVKIINNEITFEEIIYNYKSFEDSVVTSVFHMEINFKNNIITHLDHEFILYTMDEYIERQKNPAVKGTYRKRVKTFKIDNGNIPFDIDNILYPILLLGFENKALIQEYFLK